MRRNSFLGYLLIEVIVILLVMVIFKVIPNRQIAATVAGALFVGVPGVIMFLEYRRAAFQRKIWFLAVFQFWSLFAIPILGMRLLNWGVPFEELAFLGISGPTLHKWSSKSYMVMMVFTLWEYWRLVRENQEKGRWKIKKPV